jgi:hypothetical protein
MTVHLTYLDFSLSLFLPVSFLFLDHKQVASVAALVLGLRAYAVSLQDASSYKYGNSMFEPVPPEE